MSLNNPSSFLLMALFMVGSFQLAYAKVDMANGVGHSNCAEMVEMDSHDGHHDGGADAKHVEHDHEKDCADGQCAHSYCVSPVFSAATQWQSTVLDLADSKISLNSQFTIDNYPPSLYRPPRV